MNLKSFFLHPLPWVLKLILGLLLFTPTVSRGGETDDRAAAVVNAAIEALGGSNFTSLKNTVSQGRYFFFRDGRKGFAKFFDWTVYEEPIKSRFQFGDGKNSEVTVHNFALNKGWRKEGPLDLKELTEDEIEDFRRSIKKDLMYLLRNRRNEEGLSMFYYGPDEISGGGELEAVEFIDLTNDSVIVYFNRENHFPFKVESQFTDKLGLRHKRETEYYNWHEFSGIQLALRTDTRVDGELSEQTFIETMQVNQVIPEEQFLQPAVKEPKKKKGKN